MNRNAEAQSSQRGTLSKTKKMHLSESIYPSSAYLSATSAPPRFD